MQDRANSAPDDQRTCSGAAGGFAGSQSAARDRWSRGGGVAEQCWRDGSHRQAVHVDTPWHQHESYNGSSYRGGVAGRN